MATGILVGNKPIKIGVREGEGRPPGYQWSVWILDLAFDEVMDFLKREQYQHMALQVQELAQQDDPTHSSVVSVRGMSGEDFYELRDKGGVLGGMNVRVFYGVDKELRAIVVLGGIKKQNDGPTPQGDVIRMRRRWRKYKSGDYGTPNAV
jgi:hypothetical protein